MPIGSGIVYNTGDLILSQVSSSGTAFLETKIAAATSSLIYFDSTARINSASLNSITVGTASYVSGSTSIITNLTASNISASGTGSFGYIGIGTTIPNSKLEVAGTAGTGVVSVTNTGNGRSGSFGIDGNGVFIRNSNDGDYFDLKNATGTSRFRVLYDNNTFLNTTYTSVGSLTQSGSKLSVFGNLSVGSTYGPITASSNGAIIEGDVGIGTTTPTAQSNYRFLQVNGTNSAVIETMVGGTRIGGFDSTSNTLYVGSIGSFPVVFRTAVDEKMRITAAGLVGIGTSSPAQKLEVQSGSVLIRGDGNALFGTYYASAGENTFFTLHSGSGNTFHIGNDVSGTNYNTMVFTAATDSTGGKVGIGTSSPGSKLQINDNTPVLTIRANDGGTSRKAYIDFYTTFFNYPSDVGARRTSTIVTGFDSGVWGTEFLAFNVGSGSANDAALLPIERVRIDGSGNLGVGTSTIIGKLQVNSTSAPYYGPATSSATANGIFILGNTTADVVNTFGVDASATAYAWIQPRKTGTATYYSLALNPNGGNVGIGTTAPAYLLDVSGSSRHGYRTADNHYFTGSVNISGSLNATASWATNALTASYLTPTNSYTITNLTASNISASGTSSFGYVGIGTNSPIYKLDVQPTSSTVRFGQSVVGAFPANPSVFAFFGHTSLDNVNTAANYAVLQSSTGDSFLNASSGRNIYFRLGNTDKMILNSSGQFGIGTTSPIAGYLDVRSNQTKSVAGPTNITFFGSSDGSNPLGLIINHESSSGIKMIGLVGTEYGVSGNNIKINEALTVQYNGYVGIGTTVPTAQLHVCLDTAVFSAKNVVRIVNLGYSGITGAQNWTIRGAYQYAGGIAANADGGDLDIIKSLDRNTILATKTDGTALGNVGIGTTNPIATLQVSGSISGSSFTSSVSNAVGFLGTASWAQNVVTASYLVPTNSYTITNLTASGVVRAAQIAEKVVTFTPLTGSITGAPAWYRIISGSGVLDSGRVRMSANYDNSRSDIEFTYAVRNYDTDGAGAFINITRASTYNSLFNAVRVIETGNLGEPYAIDVLIGNYLNNTTPGPVTCLYESQFIGAVLDTPTFVSASATGSNIVKTVYTTYTSGYPRIGPTYSDGLAVANYQGQLTVGYRGNYAYNTPSTLNYALLVSGSVGIGTTSPGEKLSVISGSTRIASTTLAGALYLGNDGSNIYLQRDNSYDLSLVQNGDSNSALYLASAGNVYVNIDSNNNDTDKAFIVQNNALKAGTELFRIQENGNVGVGTSSPAAKLHIYNGSSHFESTSNGNATIVAGLYALQIGPLHDRDSTAGRYYGGIAFNHLLNFGGATTYNGAPQAWIGTRLQDTTGSERDYLVFATKPGTGVSGTGNDIPIERMCIDRDGLVGIGTTVPAYKLDVIGPATSNGVTLRLSDAASLANSRHILLTRGSVSGSIGIAGSQTEDPLWLSRSSGYDLIVASSGNIGIGTSIPGALLEISSSTAASLLNVKGAGGNGILFVSGSGDVAVGITNPELRFRIDGYNISASNSGTSPTNGILRLSSQALGSTNLVLDFGVDANSSPVNTWIQSRNRSNYALNYSLLLNPNGGNVGIGTTVPGALLDVSGSSRHGYRAADTHQFTGSVSISGSLNATASWATNALTASFLPVGTYNITSSWANNVVSASFATTAQTANALNTGNTYSIAGLTSAYVDVTGAGTIPSTGIYRPSSKTLGLSADATLILKINGSVSPYVTSIESGNVGIGSSSPSSKFEVLTSAVALANQPNIIGNFRGDTDGRSLIRVDNTSTSAGAAALQAGISFVAYSNVSSQPSANKHEAQIILGSTGATSVTGGQTGTLQIVAPQDIAFNVSASNTIMTGSNYTTFGYNAMYIARSGNVGIGTTGPTALLELSSSTAASLLNIKGARGNNILYVSGSGNIGINSSAFDPLAPEALLISGSTYNIISADTNINTYGQVHTQNRNAGTAASSDLVATNDTGTELGNYVDMGINSSGYTAGFIGNANDGYLYNTGSQFYIGNASPGRNLYFFAGSTSNTASMMLSASGNVGIGTTNPTAKLDVRGYIVSDVNGNAVESGFYLGSSAHGLRRPVGSNDVYLHTTTGNLYLGTTGNTSQQVTLLNSGNVGIGTVTPAAKLEITGSSNSALLNIKSPISGAILYVSGSGAVGIGTSNVGAFTLQVSGSFGATTKSFIIDHPTKAGKKLMYGSLESPYHGIRLTGRDTLKEGKCKVELPDYIYKLILHDSVNIQLTGIKCNKTLYVDDINIPENYFTIAYDKAIFESYKDYDFFWDFTAIRADVPELITEM